MWLLPASTSGSTRDLCKAPSARVGLFLSLAALTLTFLAVPLAPALLANPFYRQLNIAQAAKQNLFGRATWGLAALPQPRPGRGVCQHRGGHNKILTGSICLPVVSHPRPGECQCCFDAFNGISWLLPALVALIVPHPGVSWGLSTHIEIFYAGKHLDFISIPDPTETPCKTSARCCA